MGANQRGISPFECFRQRRYTMPISHASAEIIDLLFKSMPRAKIHALAMDSQIKHH
jgi:hypothetical protein